VSDHRLLAERKRATQQPSCKKKKKQNDVFDFHQHP
jgi:hypothetical protein